MKITFEDQTTIEVNGYIEYSEVAEIYSDALGSELIFEKSDLCGDFVSCCHDGEWYDLDRPVYIWVDEEL